MAKKRQQGRKPLLQSNPEIVEVICAHVRNGATFKDATVAAGITEAAFYSWLEKAEREEPNPLYVDFAEALARARADGKATLVKLIHEAAEEGDPIFTKDGELVGHRKGDWRAAAHILAIRDPKNYSQSLKHEHSGAVDSKPVRIVLETVAAAPVAELPEASESGE